MGHLSEKDLSIKLETVMQQIVIGSKYSHYKNPDKFYQIVAVAIDEASKLPCIVYEAQYGEKLVWIRTYDDFTQEIEHNGKSVLRFQKI